MTTVGTLPVRRAGAATATDPGRNAERLLAGLALIVLAQRMSFGPGLMPRHAVILLLLPLWMPTLARYRGARLLVVLGAAAAVSGVVLAQIARSSHSVAQNQMMSTVLVVVGVIGSVGVVLWSRSLLPLRQVGMWFGAGMLISAALNGGTLSISNPLKFGWSIPIAVFVLSAFNTGDKRVRELVALLGLALLAIASDARAMFAVCLLASILLAWQLRPAMRSRVRSWIWTAAMMAALGYAIYNVGTTLLVEGFLGEDAQLRSIQQINTTGSLILGGRPELAATAALFLIRPWGFGAGVTVSHGELLSAKAGMAAIGYQPDNGYVENYMFGGGAIEVHSNLGDLWAAFGFAGILLMLWMATLVVRNIATEINRRRASAVALFLSCWSLWNIAFSPFYSAAVIWIVTLGLLLPLRHEPDTVSGAAAADSPGPRADDQPSVFGDELIDSRAPRVHPRSDRANRAAARELASSRRRGAADDRARRARARQARLFEAHTLHRNPRRPTGR